MPNEPYIPRELRFEWDFPGHGKAVDWLRDRGFTLLAMGWSVPHGFAYCAKDMRALRYLHDQWGYSFAVQEDAEVIPPRSRQH